MSDRELKLNSISRSSKQSPRLVLEEHGNCEVPAGCGGVVLRWRGHDDPIPVKLFSFARGEYAVFLDGDALSSARPLVAPGEHVLAFRLERSPSGELVLMFAAVADEKVPLDKLPEAVSKAATSKFPKAKLDSAVKSTSGDKTTYEVTTQTTYEVTTEVSLSASRSRRPSPGSGAPVS